MKPVLGLSHWRFVPTTGILLALISGHVVLLEHRVVAGEIRWSPVGQICGYMRSVVPTRKVIRRSDGKSETLLYSNPMKNVNVVLYSATDEKASCCDASTRVGEVLTDHDGRFRFSGYTAGYYWLVIHLQAGEVKVPIQADQYDQRRCDDRNVVRIIFADAKPEPKVEVRII